MPQVTTVDYVSKDQALADFRARQPEVANLVNSLPSNPLPASFEIIVKSRDDVLPVARRLFKNPLVDNDPGTHDGVAFTHSPASP